MLGLLRLIAHTCAAFGELILYGVVKAINALIAAVGAFISWVVGLLPSMPDQPGGIAADVLKYANYFFPIGGLLAILTMAVALWAAFLLIRIPLRWAKVL